MLAGFAAKGRMPRPRTDALGRIPASRCGRSTLALTGFCSRRSTTPTRFAASSGRASTHVPVIGVGLPLDWAAPTWRWRNEATSCGVIIETASAVDAIDEIVAVDGLGFVFVGPDDLAISLGRSPTTEPTDEVVLDAIERVRSCCAERGVPAGFTVGSDAMVRRWGAAGFTVLAAASDVGVLGQGVTDWPLSARLALSEVDLPASVTMPSGRGYSFQVVEHRD